MIQPVIHDYLSQIFAKHYKLEPRKAAEEALRFLEILDLYKMKMIVGDWTVPEVVVVNSGKESRDPWAEAIEAMRAAEAREPWLAKEIQ